MDQLNKQEQLLGLCKSCGKAIYSENDISQTTPFVKCKSCAEQELMVEQQKKQEEARKAQKTLEEAKAAVRKTLIIPAVLLAVIAAGICIAKPILALFVIPGALLLYVTVVQVLWVEDPVASIFFFFLKAPKFTFGIIFELSIDGFIRLILIKLALWLIGILLSVACFALGLSISMAFAVFAFPFKLHKAIHRPEEIEFLLS